MSTDSRIARKRLEHEIMWILGHFWVGPRGPNFFLGSPRGLLSPTKISELELIRAPTNSHFCNSGSEFVSRFVHIFLWKIDFLAIISFLEDQLSYRSTTIQDAFIQCRTMNRRHILLLKNILKRSLVTKNYDILVWNLQVELKPPITITNIY